MSTLLLDFQTEDPCRNKPNRKILLIEPNYRNKYPPLGLMKLSAYHKQQGDTVVFYKGSYKQYAFDERLERCLAKIKLQGFEVEDWGLFRNFIHDYLKFKRKVVKENILKLVPKSLVHTTDHILTGYINYSLERKWDRVYVTTLFTFYWKQTIEAINFAKKVVKSPDSLYVGGVAASLIPDLFEKETGLKVDKNIIIGLLDRPGILDDNKIIIDTITPDYSILDTIDYQYPLNTGYLTYTTKGCKVGCEFCAVPKLEPKYQNRRSLRKQLSEIAKNDGARKDLILMDNNVLCSPEFPRIIQDILENGFSRDDRFIEPNRFEVLTNYLVNCCDNDNERKYIQKIYEVLKTFGLQRIRNLEIREQFDQLLHAKRLDTLETITKEHILESKNEVNHFIERYRNKTKKYRYVDFNQGLDCRYLDEEKMKLLSQLPIRPMRIAFDRLSLKEPYESAIRLAVNYGIRNLSNYILFNYKDTPEELWERLKINLDLNCELGIDIYSFPMKFIPISGEEAKSQSTYFGPHWNPKYIRAVQCVLNVTGGVVMDNPLFFEEAFGRNKEEYFEILMLPEDYILYRKHFKTNGQRTKWREQLNNLNQNQRNEVIPLIQSNNFPDFKRSSNKAVVEFMEHYTVRYRPERG